MEDKTNYMREYMRLKRAAKKVGLSHLSIGEIKTLVDAGELTPGTSTTVNHAANTNESIEPSRLNINTWVLLAIVGVVALVCIGYPFYQIYRDTKYDSDQDSKDY